jgi:hypothetical protein
MPKTRRTGRSAPPPEGGGDNGAYLVRDFLRTRHSFVEAVATPPKPRAIAYTWPKPPTTGRPSSDEGE